MARPGARRSGGIEAIWVKVGTTPLLSGSWNTIPRAVSPRITIRMPPGTRKWLSIVMTTRPAPVSTIGQMAKSSGAVTSVAGWSITMPALCSAIMPRKKPMPAAMASLSEAGMEFISQRRNGSRLRNKNSRPATNTAASAICQLNPIPLTTPNVKKALMPMPGAKPAGKLAKKPMMKQAIADATQVATNTAPKNSSFAAFPSLATSITPDRIAGLTKTM